MFTTTFSSNEKKAQEIADRIKWCLLHAATERKDEAKQYALVDEAYWLANDLQQAIKLLRDELRPYAPAGFKPKK